MEIEIHPLNEELLYSVTTYTDGVAGQLQVRTPVDFDGHRVVSRATVYLGTTQIQTNRGAVNVQFNIPAFALREAFAQWADLAKIAVKSVVDEIQSKALRQSILAPNRKKD
jgi:hypothetical protein